LQFTSDATVEIDDEIDVTENAGGEQEVVEQTNEVVTE
jgi:hypothetical protein